MAFKDNKHKNRLELNTPTGILWEGWAMTYGAIKYAEWNHSEGAGKSVTSQKLAGAAIRHIQAFLDGQDIDDGEEGSMLVHLANAKASLGMLLHLLRYNSHLDDRPMKSAGPADYNPPDRLPRVPENVMHKEKKDD